MRALVLSLLIFASACKKDETISGYADPAAKWVLTELGEGPFSARATITFPEEGRIAGQAPCNRFFADQTAPYPWFEAQSVAATKMACPELDAETAFFAALERVTLAEVLGDTLILSDEGGLRMVFTRKH